MKAEIIVTQVAKEDEAIIRAVCSKLLFFMNTGGPSPFNATIDGNIMSYDPDNGQRRIITLGPEKKENGSSKKTRDNTTNHPTPAKNDNEIVVPNGPIIYIEVCLHCPKARKLGAEEELVRWQHKKRFNPKELAGAKEVVCSYCKRRLNSQNRKEVAGQAKKVG